MSFHSNKHKLLQPYPSNARDGALPLQHFQGDLLQQIFDVNFFEYVFMIVRNPESRLLSEYKHAGRIGRLEAKLPFGAWAKLELSAALKNPYRRSNHYRLQKEFYCFNAEVFHFEDGIPQIIESLARKLELPEPTVIPHERFSPPDNVIVSSGTKDMIRRYYAADYEAFGYA